MSSGFSSKPAGAAGTTTQVTLDREAGTTLCDVIDNRTSLVPRQFCDQQFLRRRAYSRALQQARDHAHARKLDRKI